MTVTHQKVKEGKKTKHFSYEQTEKHMYSAVIHKTETHKHSHPRIAQQQKQVFMTLKKRKG